MKAPKRASVRFLTGLLFQSRRICANCTVGIRGTFDARPNIGKAGEAVAAATTAAITEAELVTLHFMILQSLVCRISSVIWIIALNLAARE